MADEKIAVLLSNIEKANLGTFTEDTCLEFMDSVWGLCRDNCEMRLTKLLGGFQNLYKRPLSVDMQGFCDNICKFLENFIKLIRARGIETETQCKELISSPDFNTRDINELITAVLGQVSLNSPDIKCIADALVIKEQDAERYVLGYSKVTSSDVITVPGILVIGSGSSQETRDVPYNVRGISATDTWFVSAVTSNLDEDRLERRNQKKTTMNSRKRLYPIYARVPVENIPRLKELLPDCGKTCIPDLECEIRAAFPAKKG